MNYKQFREYIVDKNMTSIDTNLNTNYFNIVKEGNEFAISFYDSNIDELILRVVTFKNNSWKLKGSEVILENPFRCISYSNNSKLMKGNVGDTKLLELKSNNWVETETFGNDNNPIISRNGNFISNANKIYKLSEGLYDEIYILDSDDDNVSIGNFSNNGNIFCLYNIDEDSNFRIYKFNGTNFDLYQEINNSIDNDIYRMTNSKFLSGNGKTVGILKVISNNTLSLRVFRDNGNEFVLLKDFNIIDENNSINDVAFSFDGNTMVLARKNIIGDNFIGQIEIYKYINNNWKLINKFPSNVNENGSIKVSISNNGKIVGQVSFLVKTDSFLVKTDNLNKVIFYKLEEKKKSIVLYKKFTGCKIICEK